MVVTTLHSAIYHCWCIYENLKVQIYPPGYRIWSREKCSEWRRVSLGKILRNSWSATRRRLSPFWKISPDCNGRLNCPPICGAHHEQILPRMPISNCLRLGKFPGLSLSLITQLLVECHKWNLVYLAEFIMLGQTLLLVGGKGWKGSQGYYSSSLDNFSTYALWRPFCT